MFCGTFQNVLVFQHTALTKELQMVTVLKMNQWKWMLTSLKMQMINANRTERTSAPETVISTGESYTYKTVHL
jgi:hypothetical protein